MQYQCQLQNPSLEQNSSIKSSTNQHSELHLQNKQPKEQTKPIHEILKTQQRKLDNSKITWKSRQSSWKEFQLVEHRNYRWSKTINWHSKGTIHPVQRNNNNKKTLTAKKRELNQWKEQVAYGEIIDVGQTCISFYWEVKSKLIGGIIGQSLTLSKGFWEKANVQNRQSNILAWRN